MFNMSSIVPFTCTYDQKGFTIYKITYSIINNMIEIKVSKN